jgi:hypothetical protein
LVVGDLARELFMARCGEHDAPAERPLLMQELEQLLVVGQSADVELHGLGQLGLQLRAAAQQPREELPCLHGLCRDEAQRGLQQQVGADQRTVEVDVQRRRGRAAAVAKSSGAGRPGLQHVMCDVHALPAFRWRFWRRGSRSR